MNNKKHMIMASLLIGFFMGVFLTLYFAYESNAIFLKNISIDYSIEQELLAIKAKNEKNFGKSIRHYSNLVEFYSEPALNSFSQERCERRGLCSFFSPYTILIEDCFAKMDFEKFQENMENTSSEKLRKGSKRVFMMRKAYLYEKLGNNEEALECYKRVISEASKKKRVNISEKKYIENMKIVGKGDVEFEKEFFKNMSRYYDMKF